MLDSKESRDLIKKEVKKKMLGPGFFEDSYEFVPATEIIKGRPEDVYYTGILFPSGTQPKPPAPQPPDEDFDNQNLGALPAIPPQADADGGGDGEADANDSDVDGDDGWQTSFFPNHIGLVTCVDVNAQSIHIEGSYAKYQTVAITEVKAKMHEVTQANLTNLFALYDADAGVHAILQNAGSENFADIVEIDNNAKTVRFTQLPTVTETKNGQQANRPLKGSDLPRIDENTLNEDPLLKQADDLIKLRLLGGDFHKRVPTKFNLDLNISQSSDNDSQDINSDLQLLYKVFVRNGKKYVRLLVRNLHTENDSVQDRYLFQLHFKVSGVSFVSYSEPNVAQSTEDSETEFAYRNVPNYGKGVGLAIEWDRANGNPLWVGTAYMPESIVKDFSADRIVDATSLQDHYCDVRSLSIWGDDDASIIAKLTEFVGKYEAWQQNQQNLTDNSDEARSIRNKQTELLTRLRGNIAYLQNNSRAMRCFRIANTAMYMQMVVARDKRFKKNRTFADIDAYNGAHPVDNNANPFSDISFFSNEANIPESPKYRPFQLAFLLMNVKSAFEPDDPYRTDSVDLIWFQTGGGKTEAYLALTALTIAERRSRPHIAPLCNDGVSVIMRYTLRLLTAQQFERASYLICALEFLRANWNQLGLNWGENLGQNPITIGMWVGKSVTPNEIGDLNHGDYQIFFNTVGNAVPGENPFPIQYCPWCGSKLVQLGANNVPLNGYNDNGSLACTNSDCHFNFQFNFQVLPIDYIDERIYNTPPTLLFATVDKFAQINQAHGGTLFGISNNKLSPDLIIQDELHLVSGPLGSMVGLFETMVEEMASKHGRRPKIIASTATTRNTSKLIRALYNREVKIFPPSGLEFSDNFFSEIQPDGKRLHLGVMPTGHTSVMAEINLVAILVMAKIKLFVANMEQDGVNMANDDAVYNYLLNNGTLKSELDNFWTLVLYYNSLKDLGRSKSRIPQEMMGRINRYLCNHTHIPHALEFVYKGWDTRNIEFTGRQDSSRIKVILDDASKPAHLNNNHYVDTPIDVAQATNMISVGIDIARWNVMVMMGQPRTTSEYIQSSSRVARSVDGLVVNLMNPNRIREASLFENYTSFHESYYKFVEPLSATPFTEMTVHKLIRNIAECYIVHIMGNAWLTENIAAYRNDIRNLLLSRCGNNPLMQRCVDSELGRLSFNDTALMSLRSVDPNSYVAIKQYF